jgi:hypothetical protein
MRISCREHWRRDLCAASELHVVGNGLEFIQEAFELQRKGMSAKKVVVSM